MLNANDGAGDANREVEVEGEEVVELGGKLVNVNWPWRGLLFGMRGPLGSGGLARVADSGETPLRYEGDGGSAPSMMTCGKAGTVWSCLSSARSMPNIW